MEDRIDTDLEKLMLVDPAPLGDDILDSVLAEIAEETETHNSRFWVERAAARSDEIREAAIDRLIQRGILERREDRFLWVFRSRRYPVIDGTAEREVKLRLLELLFSDMIPTPRDVVIICLADACGIFSENADQARTQARPAANPAPASTGPDRSGGYGGRVGYRSFAGPGWSGHTSRSGPRGVSLTSGLYTL